MHFSFVAIVSVNSEFIVESEACIIYTQFIISVIIHSTTRVNVCWVIHGETKKLFLVSGIPPAVEGAGGTLTTTNSSATVAAFLHNLSLISRLLQWLIVYYVRVYSKICAFVRTPFAAISTDDANSLMSYFQFLISFPKCDNAWVTHLQTEATGRHKQRETDRHSGRQGDRQTSGSQWTPFVAL